MPDKTKNQKPGIVNKNLFPVHVLPSFFKDLVKGLNETLNFPTDYTSTAILVAIATTIGTTVKVKVKDKWYEFGALYACVLGNAGANKSHPLATIFNPLKKSDISCKNIDRACSRMYVIICILNGRFNLTV